MKNIAGKTVYTVSEVNALARQTLENLSFWVEGEISSFKGLNNHYRYVYFDLKDPQTGYKLPCILEPDIYKSLDFELSQGSKVLALGSLTLWEKEAKFQMYLVKIEAFGEGFLLAELEQLKRRLARKGYFDSNIKKTLPSYPTSIAVITSTLSDAWQDFKKHTIDMFGVFKVALFDVVVQGEESAGQIIKAIKAADKMNFEAIVLIRGGGSIEDLASFNNEQLADAIFSAKTCIVVGVGHEKDVTIAQLVADVAASTPTDAAKIISADFIRLEEKLSETLIKIRWLVNNKINSYSQQLDLSFQKLYFFVESYREIPKLLNLLKKSLNGLKNTIISKYSQRLTIIKTNLINNWNLTYQQNVNILKGLKDKLSLLSPDNILKRGYSIVFSLEDTVIKDVSDVDIGSKLKVKLSRGKLLSKVLAKEL